MMSAAPPFPLTLEQAARLQEYVQTYRRYALTALMPSTVRNNTIRILQMVQGKIIEVVDTKVAVSQIVFTREEISTLRTVIGELLLIYVQLPESSGRNTALTDLAMLKNGLKMYL